MKQDDRAEQQAQAQVESVTEMIETLQAAEDAEADTDEAHERIQEDPLSVQVRSGWYIPGSSLADREPENFEILLCTGGPAVRIVGDLDQNLEPCDPVVEYQDWFTPWIEYGGLTNEQREALQRYCECFYYGD